MRPTRPCFCPWPAAEGVDGLEKAVDRICREATDAVLADNNILSFLRGSVIVGIAGLGGAWFQTGREYVACSAAEVENDDVRRLGHELRVGKREQIVGEGGQRFVEQIVVGEGQAREGGLFQGVGALVELE